MRLSDKLGVLATKLDKRLMGLVQDVDVLDFSEVYNYKNKITDSIIIGKGISLPMTYHFVEEYGLCYLVQQNHDHFLYNLMMSALICKYPDNFSKTPLPMMMRTAKGNVIAKNINFQSSIDKNRVMDETFKFLNQHSRTKSIEQNVLLIVNELLLNALYSAPTDDHGNYLYANAPRDSEIHYSKDDLGEVFLAFNDDLFVVGCKDPFGSVNKLRVTKRLSHVFHDFDLAEVEPQNVGSGGSGLGLKLVIEHSSGFGMVVKGGQETFVFASLPLGAGNRKIYEMSKNLYLKFY